MDANCICTNASRGLSATAEFLVTSRGLPAMDLLIQKHSKSEKTKAVSIMCQHVTARPSCLPLVVMLPLHREGHIKR